MVRWPPLQTNAPKLPVLHSSYNLILPQGSDVRSVLRGGHVISRGMRAGVAQGGFISPVLLSLYVNDMPSPGAISS